MSCQVFILQIDLGVLVDLNKWAVHDRTNIIHEVSKFDTVAFCMINISGASHYTLSSRQQMLWKFTALYGHIKYTLYQATDALKFHLLYMDTLKYNNTIKLFKENLISWST